MMLACVAARKPQEANAYFAAQEQFDFIVNNLRSPEMNQMSHSQVEEFLEVDGRELMRQLLEAHLEERGASLPLEPVVSSDEKPHAQRFQHTRKVESIFGTVSLTRYGYGGVGLESLHPLDSELNLPPELYSHTVRKRVAECASKESFDEVVSTIKNHTGASVAKRQVEELTVRAAEDFDSFYEKCQEEKASTDEVPETGQILVISTDGKGVVMRQEDLRGVTQKAAAANKPHLKHRRSKGEKPFRKRMATVASVYTIKPYVRQAEEIIGELSGEELVKARPRPEEKRVWASLKKSQAEVIEEAFSESESRDPLHQKEWVGLVDGNKSQLKLLESKAKECGVKLRIILDLIHVIEYLWKAAWCFHKEGDCEAEEWVSERLKGILSGKSSLVAAGMRRSATIRGLSRAEREGVEKCANYLLKYKKYLHYDEYLSKGYPIATGVIEGACRYLVKDRMEKTGARWGLTSAEAVLRLRALRASGDFEEYWEFHLEQEQERNHAIRYANSELPKLQHQPSDKKKPCHLRLIK